MYIHNYYKNPAFFDIYDFNWSENDPGNLERTETDLGFASRVWPQGWSTDPKCIAPIGADRSPPWHQICIPARRYNNIADDTGRKIGWENIPQNNPGTFGTDDFIKGTDLINNYNSGGSWNAIPIWDGPERSHLMACGHCIKSTNNPHKLVGGFGYSSWIFMNESEETYLVTRRELYDMTRIDPSTGEPLDITFLDDDVTCVGGCPDGYGCWQESDENQGRCYHRGFTLSNDIEVDDTVILEIKEIEKVNISEDGRSFVKTGLFFDTMESIGCPPITKSVNLDLPLNTTKSIPIIWGPDRQGRSVVGINIDPAEVTHKLLISDPLAGRDGNAPMMFNEYITLWSGDSGTAGWVNTKQGYVYLTLFAAGGNLSAIQSKVRENHILDYSVELVDLSDGSEYEAIDYFEHPDIEYSQSPTGGDDADSTTFIPAIPNQSLKIKSEYEDTKGNILEYTTESNTVETTNNTFPVEPETAIFTSKLEVNGNISDFGSDITLYSDNVDQIEIEFTFKNPIPTDREDFKMFSFEEDFGDEWKFLIDGIELPNVTISRIGKPRIRSFTTEFAGSTSRLFGVAAVTQLLLRGEDFSLFETGVEYPLEVNYKNTRVVPNTNITYAVGNYVFAEAPVNVRLQVDESQAYPGQQVTINLVTDNTPIPDISIETLDPNGSILNAIPSSATIVSNTSNTITIEIIGDPGELIGLIVPVFYGYDPSVDRVTQLDQFSIAFTINEPPEITAQLEVNPDINNDGFANTYEDSLNIVITNDADLDDHNWTITPKPIIE